MDEAPSHPPHAELASAYWLDSPVLTRHGMCACALDAPKPAERSPAGVGWCLVVGAACALIAAALALAVT
ncbi:hypothetical protein [Streptomyces flavofungini]|uniref:hypothetical protein n=1 Tax=Streptomyces flavofungini TaxID=68200 RepID=UPI0034DF068F